MRQTSLEKMAILLRDGLSSGEEIEITGFVEYFANLEARSIFLRKDGHFNLVSYGNRRYSLREGKDFTLNFEVDEKRKVSYHKTQDEVNLPTTLNPEASLSIQRKGDIRY